MYKHLKLLKPPSECFAHATPPWPDQLHSLRFAFQQARAAFRNRDTIILTTNPGRKQNKMIANLSRQQTLAMTKWEARLQQVVDLEERLEIPLASCWTREHTRRQQTADFMNRQDYHDAVDNLERLVVMRLFELTKLNQSGTGICLSYL